MHITPMQNMDACNLALQGLDKAAQFRSHCIDGNTGEVIYARQKVKIPMVEEPTGFDGKI